MSEQLKLFEVKTPSMPDDIKGAEIKPGGFTHSQPRKWNNAEVAWLKEMKEQGFSNKEIAESMGRTEVSIGIKLKRLGKSEKTYNKNHIIDKYETNKEFCNLIKPKSIIDAYSGANGGWYKQNGYKAITNDINASYGADYSMDAFKFMCQMYIENKKVDIVDLDPFGSAFDSFDLAIKLAQKGLIITLGEIGHKRWKRTDYVERFYGITDYNNITPEAMIKEIQKIGLRNKKELKVIYLKEWANIARVYFTIENIKITEQWDK